MNRRQKAILIDFVVVIVITAVAMVAMINFKDWVNRSEAMRAMEHLSEEVLAYQKETGLVPPESYVEEIRTELEGHVRLGKLVYRARWIDFESSPDEILAYTFKKFSSLTLFSDGFIVLRLDGRVEWMNEQTFKTLFAAQRHPMENDD